MGLGIAGLRSVAVLFVALCAATPAAAATITESYFSLDRLKIPFRTGEAYQRVLIVDLDLAVPTTEDKEKVKTIRHLIKAEIEKALGAQPVADFEAGNLASVVKAIARVAAQRAAGTEVRIADALIRSARLL
jgi:ABC-type phosphate/phosphonate transport system substrate-binding protein